MMSKDDCDCMCCQVQRLLEQARCSNIDEDEALKTLLMAYTNVYGAEVAFGELPADEMPGRVIH